MKIKFLVFVHSIALETWHGTLLASALWYFLRGGGYFTKSGVEGFVEVDGSYSAVQEEMWMLLKP